MNLPKSLALVPKYEAPSSWWEHVPVAHILIELLKPRVVVELGSHYGVSFFSFCEAAERFSPETCVYAIDSWTGDEHAGYYGDSIYQQVQSYRDRFHKQNGVLIKDYFEGACEKFEDNSIDIIHIDGLHTYEAVKNDYEMWGKKLKEKGTLLFHDWNVKEKNFGVWRLWEEIKGNEEYKVLEFPNGYGLGIATRTEKKPEWHNVLENCKEQLVTKGIMLDRIYNLESSIRKQNSEMNDLKVHIKNLELINLEKKDHIKNLEKMNIDKQEQIETADNQAKEILIEHNKLKEILVKHEEKKKRFIRFIK